MTTPAPAILRRPEVERRTGLGRSTIYERMARGEFPAAVSLGARAVGWRESDVNAWITGRASITRCVASQGGEQ